MCEKAVGPERSCTFRSGRMILQQPVEREQMKKLLETGRTDLLNGFVSKKGRRFKAYLVKTPDGKVGFEFQPRPERASSGRTGRGMAPPAATGESASAAAPAAPKPSVVSRRTTARRSAAAGKAPTKASPAAGAKSPPKPRRKAA